MNHTGDSAAVVSQEARKWAMICHVIALIGLLGNGLGYLIGPLVVWLIKREDDPFIDEQGTEAVNFQITMLIAAVVSALLTLILIGFVLLIAVWILMTVLPIVAAIKANDGEHYRYPLSIRFIK